MEQFSEFAGNHPLLVGGFFVAVALLIASEIARRLQSFSELTTAEAVRLINQDDTVIVDVSSLADFNKGHIAASRHMPPSQLAGNSPEIEKLKNSPILVVCKNGQAAPQAAGKLVKLGCENVSLLKGGIAQWRADNYPLSKG